MTLLSQVATARKLRPPRILVLGTQKVGKSTFASQFEKPVCLPIVREEGIDDLDVQAFPVSRSYMEAKQALMELGGADRHDFSTVFVDSISALEPLIEHHVVTEKGVDSLAKIDGGYGRQFDTIVEKWQSVLDALDICRNDRKMASILIGHVTITTFDDAVAGTSYKRYDLDCKGPVRNLIYRWVDVILFADWKVFTNEEDAGFNKTNTYGSGDGSRRLFTQMRPNHPGGGRGVYGRLPYELPFSYADFMRAVKDQFAKEKQADSKPQRKKERKPELVSS